MGLFSAHYTGLQPTVLKRNIRANRDVSNNAAWLGVEKKRGSCSTKNKKTKKKGKKLLIRIVLTMVP